MDRSNIEIHKIETKSKNSIEVFFNRDTSLLVVELVDKNGNGGNEIVRMFLDEKELLKHCEF
jgi:hypothetical protein